MEHTTERTNISILKNKNKEINSILKAKEFITLCKHLLPDQINSLYKIVEIAYDVSPKVSKSDIISNLVNVFDDIIALGNIEYNNIIYHGINDKEPLSIFKNKAYERRDLLNNIINYFKSICEDFDSNKIINIYRELDIDDDLKLFTIAPFL